MFVHFRITDPISLASHVEWRLVWTDATSYTAKVRERELADAKAENDKRKRDNPNHDVALPRTVELISERDYQLAKGYKGVRPEPVRAGGVEVG